MHLDMDLVVQAKSLTTETLTTMGNPLVSKMSLDVTLILIMEKLHSARMGSI